MLFFDVLPMDLEQPYTLNGNARVRLGDLEFGVKTTTDRIQKRRTSAA